MNRIIFIIFLCICPQVFGQYWWHKTPSAKADTSDATFIRPSDWNAAHIPFPESSTFISDDFLVGATATGTVGELGWATFATSSGTFGIIAGVADHPGVDTMSSGATAGGVEYMYLTSVTAAPLLSSDSFDLIFIIKLSQSDANTSCYFGLADGLGNPNPSNGIIIQKLAADNNWFGCNRLSSVSTRTAAMDATGTGWVRFRIRRYDYATDSIGFSINGGTEKRLSATTAPSTDLTPIFQISNNSVAASKIVYVDYFSLRVWPVTR